MAATPEAFQPFEGQDCSRVERDQNRQLGTAKVLGELTGGFWVQLGQSCRSRSCNILLPLVACCDSYHAERRNNLQSYLRMNMFVLCSRRVVWPMVAQLSGLMPLGIR
jgi:predicted DNA-binding ribbon-helix-helix protein